MSRFRSLRRQKLDRYREYVQPADLIWGEHELDDVRFLTLMSNAIAAGPADIGLRVGAGRRIADLGLLGHVTMSCQNLAEVARVWESYADDAGEMVHIRSSANDDDLTWTICFVADGIIPGHIAETMILELCASFFAYARELTGSPFAEFETYLPYRKSPEIDYTAFIPGQIHFDVGGNARLTGPVEAFSRPILYCDPQALRLLTSGLALEKGQGGADELTVRLADYFLRQRGRSSSARAAQSLGISERTMRRKLAALGTTYGHLLSCFRSEYGCALIKENRLAPKQIAHVLGFADENSLRRAFRQWKGQSIQQWMRSNGNGPGREI